MKKIVVMLVLAVFTLVAASSAYAVKCPQPRKTKAAPGAIWGNDKTAKADKESGKKIYHETAKPMACKMCHGEKGAGDGNFGKALIPGPQNFTCKATMKKVSAGQMLWIIKNGSKGTGMLPYKQTEKKTGLKDQQIWDVIKYVREDLAK